MPWSNQNGGGGGWKGGGGPWGQGPSGGGQLPDLEEILKRSQDRLKQAMPGGGMGGGFLALILLVVAAVVGFFGFTVSVKPDEQGVVLRFGALKSAAAARSKLPLALSDRGRRAAEGHPHQSDRDRHARHGRLHVFVRPPARPATCPRKA